MSRWRWLLGGNDDDCVERHTKSTPNEKNDIKEEEEIPLLYEAIGKGKKTTSRKKSVAALAMMSFAMALALLAFCGAVGRRETVGLESRLGARMYMVFWGRDGFDYDDAAVLASNRAPLGNSTTTTTTTTTKSESTNNNTDTNATEEEEEEEEEEESVFIAIRDVFKLSLIHI